jgi:hypothetical protein
LAVLAAVCLVAAFALAVLLPPTLSLLHLIAMTDHAALLALQDGVVGHLGDWTWQRLFMPVLARPCWLMPLMLGVVLGGASLSLALRSGLPRSPRWRN